MERVYINLDAELKEENLTEEVPPLDAARFMPAMDGAAAPELVAKAAALLRSAKHPIILAGRASRAEAAWDARIALAAAVNAKVFTDLKIGASFPTAHPL